MKKVFLTLLLVSAVSLVSEKAFAQFEKGDKILNLGIGGGGYGFYGSGVAIGASFEAGVHEFVSIGAQADFRFYNYSYYFGPSSNYISIPIAARGSYHYGKHFLKIDQLDLYAGPALGFNIDGNEYYTSSGLVIGAFAGARWYFKDNFGVFLELAGGNNMIPAKAGISLKF